jgi:hypothetical protein
LSFIINFGVHFIQLTQQPRATHAVANQILACFLEKANSIDTHFFLVLILLGTQDMGFTATAPVITEFK